MTTNAAFGAGMAEAPPVGSDPPQNWQKRMPMGFAPRQRAHIVVPGVVGAPPALWPAESCPSFAPHAEQKRLLSGLCVPHVAQSCPTGSSLIEST
jgi:hypothetical protein